MADFLKSVSTMAELTRAHYDTYIAVGFSEQQALYLAGRITAAHVESSFLPIPESSDLDIDEHY